MSFAIMPDIEDLEPPPPRTLAEVIEKGLCSSCGACEAVLGPAQARMTPGFRGRLRPALHPPLTPAMDARALAVCPGARVGGPTGSPDCRDPGATMHPIIGPIRSVRKGHASDTHVRTVAAAAGGLTGLALHMLSSGEVDFVVHVSASRLPSEDIRGRLSFDRESVLAGCGSRYAPVAPLASIGEALDLGRPFAFIGKPCDINGLRNLARVDPRVDQQCRAMLTISCGSYADPTSYEGFLAENNMAPGEVAEFRYRGHGCPGWSPYARTTDGREARADYVDWWFGGARPLTYQWRCKTCPDFLGYEADVTVMDCWPKGLPEHHTRITPERAGEQDGWIVAVGRTALGEALLDRASAAGGTLTLVPSPTEDILGYQPHQVTRAVGVFSRRLAHAHLGMPQPALSPGRARLMLDAAFSPGALAALAEVASGKSQPAPARAETEAMVRGVMARLGVPVEEAAVGFHARNYDGCIERIRRGDPTEAVPSVPAGAG